MGLGLESNFFTPYCDAKDNTLRLLYYPPVQKQLLDQPSQRRIGEHTDYGTITLLFQDSVGGLQVKNHEGNYVQATPIEGTIVVNAADLLARWSNDLIKSTEHRVVSPPYDPLSDSYPARYSIAYFCHPNFAATIACLDGTWDDQKPKKYPPINSLEYLVQRLSATY